MRDAIQEMEDAVETMRRAWDAHDCKADEEEAHAAGYDEGRADLIRELLDDVFTWQRQEAVGLVTGTMTLDEIKNWLRRKKS